ncbi:MAG: chloride channel protein [Microthrixaceae bacterium]
MLPSRTSPSRLLLLSLLAVAIGLLGGAAAFVLINLIGAISNLVLLQKFSWSLPSFNDLKPGPALVLIPVAGAVIVSLMARWAPQIRGHGIPEAMEAILTDESRIPPRTAVAKPISSAIAIGTGGPFGAEGPIIVTGGALGSLIGQWVPTSPSERKILLACGAAAGMSATFGAPLAAVMLAIELLLFEFSSRAFVPLVVSSSIAAGVHSLAFGTGPLFPVPPQDYSGLGKLPFYALLGLACGLLAVVINRGLFLFEGAYRRLPVSRFWHPIIGAIGFGMVGLAVPRVLGVGYDTIGDVLDGRLALGTIAVLGSAKLLAWWLALASGTSGGTVAPLLLISGCFGTLAGAGVNQLIPSLQVTPGAFALVAMAATFGAAVGATFTGIVFLFELTRDYEIILPLMLASVAAELVTSALMHETLMTEKLSRHGIHVQGEYRMDVLAGTSIREIMSRDVDTLSPDTTLAEARALARERHHSAYPVVDADGRCLSMVSSEDLIDGGSDADADETVAALGTHRPVTVSAGDSVLEVFDVITSSELDHVPVCDDGRLVGIVTRKDIVRARLRQSELEQRQPGFHLRRFR